MRLIDADALERDGWTLHRTVKEYPMIMSYQMKSPTDLPFVDAVPVIRCYDCKYFKLNHLENVSGMPLIVAHEICTKWGDGCKTLSDGYCFMAEKRKGTEE